jgi:hypothetical protein
MGTITNVRRAIIEYTYSVLNAYSSTGFNSKNKVIWANTTDNRTAMPFCYLEVLNMESLGHATSSELVEIGSIIKEIRRERQIMAVSFNICAQQNATHTTNLAADTFALEAINTLRFKLKSRESLSNLYFTNSYQKQIAVQYVSSVRNLTDFEETDFKFQYSFDAEFAYVNNDEIVIYSADDHIDLRAKGASMDVEDNTSDYEETNIDTTYST